MVPDALSNQAGEDADAYAATIVECQGHLIDAARRIETLSAAL